MLHLITGTNGAGKTLHALKWVMERSVKENRPVCHNGRFKPKVGGPLDGWKQIDFKDWQDEPDGTIFLIDECHNDLPNRSSGAAVPEHVKMLAEHRRRGFDFYLISQHPANVDSFVRRLIGSPGWHRHIKRLFGQDFVSVLEWDAVNVNCEKANASAANGSSSQSRFPKEVYQWYESATIHTNKKKIPKMVWLFLAAVLVAGWFTYSSMRNVGEIGRRAVGDKTETAEVVASPSASASSPAARKLTVDEYLDLRRARIPDLPHTAPVYDEVTKPVVAPFPAACVQSASKCECFTQQATRLHITESVCKQIVKEGYFVDWNSTGNRPQQMQQAPPQQLVKSTPTNAPAQNQDVGTDWELRMRERNAGVVSAIGR